MKLIIKALLIAFSLFPIAAHAEGELAGVYKGKEWGVFAWGNPCEVRVTYFKDRGTYTFRHSSLSVSKDSNEFNQLVENSSTKKITFSNGGNIMEYLFGSGTTAGEISIKNGRLSKLYIWNTRFQKDYLSFTCGKLRKIEEIPFVRDEISRSSDFIFPVALITSGFIIKLTFEYLTNTTDV